MILTDSWLFWAISSMILIGIHAFRYKALVEKGGDNLTAQAVLAAVVCFLSAIALIRESGEVAGNLPEMVGVAILQGALFFFSTLARLDALKHNTAVFVLFPILKLSTPLVILITIIVFEETTFLESPHRILGLALILIPAWLLIDWRKRESKGRIGIAYALLAMAFSAGAILSSKYVHQVTVSIFAFMLVSNLTQLLLAVGLWSTRSSLPNKSQFKAGWQEGIITGVLSFAGFASFLQAIKLGDLGPVAAVNSLYIIIPVILTTLLYRDKEGVRFTFVKQLAVLLSIVGVILLH